MSNVLEFLIKMQDLMSAPLRKVSASLGAAQAKAKDFNNILHRAGGGVDDLRHSLDRLRQVRDLIHPSNTAQIRAFNTQINSMERNLNRMQTMNGSRLKTWAGDAMSQIPGAGLINNPLVMGGAAIAGLVKAGSTRQDMQTSLGVMLGEKNAASFLPQVQEMAAKTPFETGDLIAASQTMTGFGIAQEKLIPAMKMLGDVSMGNKEKFAGLALVYSQVQATGRLMGQDLNQMINQGFNPLMAISEMTGRSMAQLKDDMEKGAISADMVTAAFERVTGPGGRFNGMMDKMSQTFSGQLSTAMDTFKNTLAELGLVILPVVTTALRVVNGLFQFVIDNGAILSAGLAAVAVGYWAANAAAIGASVGLRLASIAAWALNSALLANPVTWIVAGVTALVIVLKKAWDGSETFRASLYALWEVTKEVGQIIYDYLIEPLEVMGKLLIGAFTLDFDMIEGAWKQAGEWVNKTSEGIGERIGNAWRKGYDKGVDSFIADQPQQAARMQYGIDELLKRVNTTLPLKIDTAQAYEGIMRIARVIDKMLGGGTVWQDMAKQAWSYKAPPPASAAGVMPAATDARVKNNVDSVTGGGPRVININGVKFADTVQIHGGSGKTANENAEEYFHDMFLRLLNSGANMAQ